MNVPAELKYTKEHEWVKVDGNIATYGITEHAAGELGDVVYVDIPEDDAEFGKGDSFGTIEAVKTVADLYAPVGGKITEVNEALEDAPETVNSDPYGDGWIIKFEIADAAELDGLLSADDYKALLG
jgi:glycine cleavage system H protein